MLEPSLVMVAESRESEMVPVRLAAGRELLSERRDVPVVGRVKVRSTAPPPDRVEVVPLP
jgi:hypothetical protein